MKNTTSEQSETPKKNIIDKIKNIEHIEKQTNKSTKTKNENKQSKTNRKTQTQKQLET